MIDSQQMVAKIINLEIPEFLEKNNK